MLRKGDTADVGVDDHHHGHSIMATIRHHQITQSLIVLILLILTMPAMLIDMGVRAHEYWGSMLRAVGRHTPCSSLKGLG